MSPVSFEQAWITRANTARAGRHILEIVHADRHDTRAPGWSLRPPAPVLGAGLRIRASADAAGDDAGALMIPDQAAATPPPPLRLETIIPRPQARR